MRDYKPHIQASKRHISRKLVLFIVIATIATLYFMKTGIQPPDNIPQSSSSVTSIKLPPAEKSVPQQTKAEEPQLNHTFTRPAQTTEPQVTSDTEVTRQVTMGIPDNRSDTSDKTDDESSEIPTASMAADSADIPVMSATWETYMIKPGDSLANIFKDWNLSPTTLHNIVHSSKLGKSLADVRPGEELKLLRDDDDKLQKLVLQRSPIESLNISRTEKGYQAEVITRDVEVRHAYAQGVINSSLFVDGQNAGLSDAQIMEMAGIFGWDIDFALEIRKGDEFRLVYETHYLDGKKLENGPILAAEFRNNKSIYRAVRYTNADNETGYYDPDDGRNKKRAFLRTPVKFARISSRFTNSRYHPKLKKWRAHRGVDYAAPTGTPVKATGNGKVTFRGKQHGYGNVVFIQHGSKYTTVYAHLSKFSRASKKGKHVSQGQIIGYVGQTGLATGPHLHYEFRVNGVHRNPLTVKLPKAEPIEKKYQDNFKQSVAPLIAELDTYTEQQVAQLPGKHPDAN